MREFAFIGVIALIVGLALGWMIFRDDPQKARADAATAQAGLNATSGAIADKAGETTTRIIVQSEARAHEVEKAPGGDAPIPPAVRAGWAGAIDGMRQRPAAGSADHPGQPAR